MAFDKMIADLNQIVDTTVTDTIERSTAVFEELLAYAKGCSEREDALARKMLMLAEHVADTNMSSHDVALWILQVLAEHASQVKVEMGVARES